MAGIRKARLFSLDAARKAPLLSGELSSTLLAYGSMTLEFYAPRGVDTQTPHTKDEVYIVMHGHGRFRHGSERSMFNQGDAIFVPAGMEHRFEDFSDDLETWVIFYGPEGGE